MQIFKKICHFCTPLLIYLSKLLMKLFDVYPLYNVEPVSALGFEIIDSKGDTYFDFYGGHAVISIGHSHPKYIKSLTDQLNRIAFYSNSVLNPMQNEVAQRIADVSGLNNYQLFFVNSGAEANENALKLASFHNGRKKVIAFKKAFHGRTSAAVNVTPDAKIVAPINATFEKVFFDLTDIEGVCEEIFQGDVAAVIIEGIQGVGGVHVPSAELLQKIQKACTLTDTVLILDEVQSGYGRSGKFFAFQHAEGVEPDVVTMAKGMGNGFPVGGLLIHEKFAPRMGMLGTTFGGNQLACAACISVLDVIKSENLMHNAQVIGDYAMAELKKVHGVKEVRGMGLMIGFSFDFPIAELRKRLVYNEHIFIGSSSEPNTIRFLPPLTIGKKEIDILVAALNRAIATLFS